MNPPSGELELTGRITTASNATFLGTLGDVEVVYKPTEGERPLWDFPGVVLAHREVAAHAVSEALEWSVVPLTWLGEGPFGEGMLQLWQDVDPVVEAVDLIPSDELPDAGWRRVFEGRDDDDRRVSLIHEDSSALRRMAVFDVIVNNADRKGGHVLAMPDGHRYGVDHGITFHVEPKLRTVLWGWIGEPLADDELAAVARLRSALGGALGASLEPLLPAEELAALDARCARLLADGVFPSPSGDMPPIPYPLF
ncbi:SCO1664 family protein [Cnuibacter physcomitrellae]|uniref:SCO1664 family protein n=1 Tax=Cnuibacter physcomitrellae TaxID=1619308 RepID=UPI0021759D9F|nr:SCO1664 family protein [Cnuibacter physcomitrellae]MCS5498401.1 SCO1664 family protein [Cnuibacter physcomitrellae]